MPIQLNEKNGGKRLVVHVSGRLAAVDYERFVPKFDRLVREHGRVRVLFNMTGFQGWTAGAFWEDTKFALHHFYDIDRLQWSERRNGRKGWRRSVSRSRTRRSDTSITLTRLTRGAG